MTLVRGTRSEQVGIVGGRRDVAMRLLAGLNGILKRLAGLGPRGWAMIVAAPLVLAGLALAWRLLLPAAYTAETRLRVDPGVRLAGSDDDKSDAL
ncbi:MAG: hypothetical protein KDJ41_06000, partial [Hyphomicrobiaceae bacterium]|nr:hypothetical protein [Hyphomicrobiaceae bacterium]